MADVEAMIVDDIDSTLGADAGAIEFVVRNDTGRIAGLSFRCPCGCGLEGYLPVGGEGRPGPSWDWNGETARPTLSPSVFNTGFPCRWHGWLKDGIWRSV